jgi:hypothetical protein
VEGAWQTLSPALVGDGGEAADLTLAAMVALLTNRAAAAEGLVRRAVDIQPGGATAQMVLALHLLHQGGDPDAARAAAALAVSFAPEDAEIAVVAKFAGAEIDPAETPAALPLPRATPAQIALADCVAAVASGDLAAARAAPAGWSLCHLAATLPQ